VPYVCYIPDRHCNIKDNIVPFKFLQLPQKEQDNTMALQLTMQLFEVAR